MVAAKHAAQLASRSPLLVVQARSRCLAARQVVFPHDAECKSPYLRPFGRRKILFIWEAIERDMHLASKREIGVPMAAGGVCRG